MSKRDDSPVRKPNTVSAFNFFNPPSPYMLESLTHYGGMVPNQTLHNIHQQVRVPVDSIRDFKALREGDFVVQSKLRKQDLAAAPELSTAYAKREFIFHVLNGEPVLRQLVLNYKDIEKKQDALEAFIEKTQLDLQYLQYMHAELGKLLKLRPWAIVYAALALDCSVPVLEALHVHWPTKIGHIVVK